MHRLLSISPAFLVIIFLAAWCSYPPDPTPRPAPTPAATISATQTPWRSGPSATAVPATSNPHILTTSSWSISGSARDSYDDGTSIFPSLKYGITGQGTAVELTGGFQFAALGIPTGQVAISATFSFVVTATAGTAQFTIFGEAADSCVNWAGRFPKDSAHTTASVNWTPGGGTGSRKYSGNIASIITEIITRPGWTNTSNLCLTVVDNQASNTQNQTWITYDSNPDASVTARLDVEYNAPTATPTPTPTVTNTPTVTPTPTVTQTPTPCSYAFSDMTWSGVYTLTCNMAIPTQNVLTMTAGTDVRFAGPYRFDIFGILRIQGTAAQPVTMTASYSTGKNAWGPLAIMPHGRAEIAGAVIKNARSVDVDGPTWITSTTIETSTIGLHFTYPGSVASSTLTYNTTGILLQQNTQPTITATNLSATTNDLAVDNRQPLTVTLDYVYWYTTTGSTIDSHITDQLDDYRLGPVIWPPAATTPY